MSESWSREAHKYDAAFAASQLHDYRTGGGGDWQARVESVLDLAGAPCAGRVMDLGCGVGTFAIRYAGLGCSSVGVDASPPVLAAARTQARNEGVMGCSFVAGDVSAQPFASGSFAPIVAAHLEHLPMPVLTACVAECRRLLVPDGRLVIHTTPTRYQHVFDTARGYLPLLPFALLPGRLLDRVVAAYDRLRYEALSRLTRGETRYQMYVRSAHPNPLAYATLRRLLLESGLRLERFLVGNLEKDQQRPAFARACRLFPHAKSVYKHIWAVARARAPEEGGGEAGAEEAWAATEIRREGVR